MSPVSVQGHCSSESQFEAVTVSDDLSFLLEQRYLNANWQRLTVTNVCAKNCICYSDDRRQNTMHSSSLCMLNSCCCSLTSFCRVESETETFQSDCWLACLFRGEYLKLNDLQVNVKWWPLVWSQHKSGIFFGGCVFGWCLAASCALMNSTETMCKRWIHFTVSELADQFYH